MLLTKRSAIQYAGGNGVPPVGIGLLAALLLLMTGCARKQPEFRESARAEQLVPEARAAVKEQLTDLFGTLASPRSPHWMPIERGGRPLPEESLAQNQGGSPQLKLHGEAATLRIQPGMLIEGLTDPLEQLNQAAEKNRRSLAPVTAKITLHDSATALITLEQALPAAVTENTPLVLDPNAGLRSGQQLYNKHCQLCHSDTGDGRGPQSQVLNPKPRDFRLGIFKYTSTQPGVKASTADLHRVIEQGIAGTGMPAFQALTRPEIAEIAEYVKYLAIRGETEQQLCIETEIDFSQQALQETLSQAKNQQEKEQARRIFQRDLRDFLRDDFPELTYEATLYLGGQWERGDDSSLLVLPQLPQTDPRGFSQANPEVKSLQNGKRLYHSNNLQCVSCHGETGRGDGEQTRLVQKAADGSNYPVPGLHDQWGQLVKPRDLSYGVFHGGRQPIDLFRRIAAGVKGTPMPAYGAKGLSDAELWDLVNYLYFLAGDYPEIAADSPTYFPADATDGG